jgi:hypothetical protein
MLKRTLIILIVSGLQSLCTGQVERGFLDLQSNPTGANFSIDGKNMGKTPAFIELETGVHRLEITYEDFESKALQLRISSNVVEKQRITLREVHGFKVKKPESNQLEQEIGQLTIITNPTGSTIRIDGRLVEEKTPLTITDLGAGYHNLLIRNYVGRGLDDTLEIESAVTIRPNKTRLLRIDMDEYIKHGNLELSSNLEHKVIELKNQKFHKELSLSVPSSTSLVAGEYELNLPNDAGRPLSFKILPGHTTKIFVPVKRSIVPSKTVEEHKGYVSLEEYMRANYTPLPEYIVKDITAVRLNWGGVVGVAVGAFFINTALDRSQWDYSKGSADLARVFVGTCLGGAPFVAGVVSFFKTESDTTYLKENILENEVNSNRSRGEYDRMLARWKAEIELENQGITATNQQIERENRELSQPRVTYE